MVKCAQCKRKFRKRGKIITWQTPDYIQVTHPRRGIEGFYFCSNACFYRWYARVV
jgi:hypothetical protein